MFARSVGCSCLLFMVYGLILYIAARRLCPSKLATVVASRVARGREGNFW